MRLTARGNCLESPPFSIANERRGERRGGGQFQAEARRACGSYSRQLEQIPWWKGSFFQKEKNRVYHILPVQFRQQSFLLPSSIELQRGYDCRMYILFHVQHTKYAAATSRRFLANKHRVARKKKYTNTNMRTHVHKFGRILRPSRCQNLLKTSMSASHGDGIRTGRTLDHTYTYVCPRNPWAAPEIPPRRVGRKRGAGRMPARGQEPS